jgi:hypothetical protein
MFRRNSRSKRAKRAAGRLPSGEEVRGQVAGLSDDLNEALDSARDAIARAISSAGQRGAEAGAQATRKTAELGKEVGRKGVAAGGDLGRKARKRARRMALDAVERLPEPEQVAELARRAEERLLPEVAKRNRKDRRKRTRRRMAGGAFVAGLGMLIGWLTAPRKGDEVRQAIKERAGAAGGKVAEMRANAMGANEEAGTTGPSTGTTEPKQGEADVTPLHQGDGAPASKQRS